MNETQFFTALKTVLANGFAARSIAGVTIDQGYQPRMQGAPSGYALYMWKVFLHPYGFPKVRERWVWADPPTNPPTGVLRRSEAQQYEMSVQFTASVNQPVEQPNKPATLLPLTGGDLCKITGRILQNAAGLDQLKAAGIGTQRMSQAAQIYIKDDTDAFSQSPNFTLVFTFIDTDVSDIPFVEKFGLKVVPI